MIKRFHVLYVGQIDLDNVGLQGTPANDRRYPNDQLSEVFFTARDVARLCPGATVQLFSSLKREGVSEAATAIARLAAGKNKAPAKGE